MHYGNLPGIDKPISRLVQGTASFRDAEPQQGIDLLDLALANGYNTFDTAHIYGPAKEKLVGKWIRDRKVRDRVVILAKGAHHDGDGGRVTPEAIESDMRDTMNHMEVDYIDLYVLHRDDPSVHVGAIVEALNEHVRAGRIGAFGGSNWSYDRIRAANEYAKDNGLIPFAVSSPNFSLAEQVEEPWLNCETISGPEGTHAREWYSEHRNEVALFTWSSLAGGFWSDRFTRENYAQLGQAGGHDALCVKCYCYEQNFERLDRVRELARIKGITVPQVALAYVMSQPMNIFALVFCANDEQFKSNVAALDIKLTHQEIAWLDLRADSAG